MEKKVTRNGDVRINSLTHDQISRIQAQASGSMVFNNEDDLSFVTLRSRALHHRQRALNVDECLGTNEYSRAFLEALSHVKSAFTSRKSEHNQLVFESSYSVFNNRPCAFFTIYEQDTQLYLNRVCHYNYFFMGQTSQCIEKSSSKTTRLYIDNWYDLYSLNWNDIHLKYQGKHTNCLITASPNTRLTPGMWVVDKENSIFKGWKVFGGYHVFVCINLSAAGPIMKYYVVHNMDNMTDLMAHIFRPSDAACDFSDYYPVGEAFDSIFELALSFSELRTPVDGYVSESISMLDHDDDHYGAFLLALRGRNPNLSVF